ncbi:hypothetical protein L195_g050668, partial [Trifolium pratense]
MQLLRILQPEVMLRKENMGPVSILHDFAVACVLSFSDVVSVGGCSGCFVDTAPLFGFLPEMLQVDVGFSFASTTTTSLA